MGSAALGLAPLQLEGTQLCWNRVGWARVDLAGLSWNELALVGLGSAWLGWGQLGSARPLGSAELRPAGEGWDGFCCAGLGCAGLSSTYWLDRDGFGCNWLVWFALGWAQLERTRLGWALLC